MGLYVLRRQLTQSRRIIPTWLLETRFCHRDFAKGVFRSQKSKGRICYMHTHTLTSITSIKRVPLTSEINVTPRDHSAADCCYNLLPVCREGNWGMHVGDQTLSPSRSERGFPSTRSPPAHLRETQHESKYRDPPRATCPGHLQPRHDLKPTYWCPQPLPLPQGHVSAIDYTQTINL